MSGDEDIAVITGGASGIGLGIAKTCVKRQMEVIIADIEKTALDVALKELRRMGGNVRGVLTDVSKAGEVEALSDFVFSKHPAIHFLFLNAGVNVRMPLWEHSINDWQWIIGVNLMGVIHGIHYFVPRMIEQEVESHLITTASIMGLMSGMDAYSMTKHAVIALTEALYGQVRNRTKKLHVATFCPEFVQSKILHAERNRPEDLKNEMDIKSPEVLANLEAMRTMNKMGISPEKAGELLFKGVENKDFYILTKKNTRIKKNIESRIKQILNAFE